MSRRTERVADLLREELASLIQRKLKDPRVADALISLTEVVVTPDFRQADVFVSHLGDEASRARVLEGLQHSAPWLQEELGRRIRIRRVPVLSFRLDPSLERGAKLTALIDSLAEEREQAGRG